MRKLTLDEIRQARSLAEPDRIKQCGVASALIRTYFPALCDMAEEYCKARASAFHDGTRTRYSIFTAHNGEVFGIESTDGFKLLIGKGARETCETLVERFNAL